MLELRILGGLSLHDDGHDLNAPHKPLLALATLAIHARRRMRRGQLARLLWPNDTRARAASKLRQARHTLRSVSFDADLVKDGDYVCLPTGMAIDLWELESALGRGGLDAAVAIYRGHLLDPVLDSMGPELALLAEGRDAVLRGHLHEAVRNALDRGDPDTAARAAESFAAIDPLDETMRTLLVRALAGAGRPDRAIAEYEAFALLLDDDRPSPRFAALVDEIRTRVAHRAVPARAPDPPIRPGSPSTLRRAGLGFAVAAALGAWIALAAGRQSSRAPVELSIPIRESGRSLRHVAIRGTSRSLSDATRLPMDYRARFDGSLVAFTVDAGEDGYDLAAGFSPASATTIVTGRPDQKPLDIAPGERGVLYSEGAKADNPSGYEVRILWYDMAGGTSTLVRRIPGSVRVFATWSGDGRHLGAVILSRTEAPDTLLVATPDGTERFVATGHFRSSTTWSPSSEWLATVERRTSGDRVSVRRWDGTGYELLRHISDARILDAAWLTEHILLVSIDFGFGADVWALSRDGRLAQVTDLGRVERVDPGLLDVSALSRLDSVPLSSWTLGEVDADGIGATVDDLTLHVPPVVAEGEYFTVPVQARTNTGRVTRVLPTAVTWVELPPFVELLPSGVFRALSVGTGSLRASIGGWSPTTGTLRVGRVRQAPAQTVLAEDWSDPRSTAERWMWFGTPQPRVAPAGVLEPNGDGNYLSGAYSRQAFPVDDGITLEVRGQLPLTGGIFQGLTLALVETPPDPVTGRWPTHQLARLSIGAENALNTRAHGRIEFPKPHDTDQWRRYALQVAADGSVMVLVDGMVQLRSDPAEVTGSFHVVLGGTAVGTTARFGPVDVYAGMRYRDERR